MDNIILYCRQGPSDKVYEISLHKRNQGCFVDFAYGRRGSTLNTGTKTPTAVTETEARKIFDKLVKEKMAKGYKPGPDAPEYQHNGHSESSGVECQLLNPAINVKELLNNQTHWMQEKFDGRRLLIKKEGQIITGINRLGLTIAIPQALVESAANIQGSFIIDGEAVGDILYAFDLVSIDGRNIQLARYADRHFRLWDLLNCSKPIHIQTVETYSFPDKKDRFHELKGQNKEGVVFKHIDAPYIPGRPNSGGSQVKHKFYETASFVVAKVNAKRSVSLILFDGEKVRTAGNVTIPANHDIPSIGSVVECRYLYAFKESGSIYQPVFPGRGEDVRAAECQTTQLRFKAEAMAVY